MGIHFIPPSGNVGAQSRYASGSLDGVGGVKASVKRGEEVSIASGETQENGLCCDNEKRQRSSYRVIQDGGHF